MTTMKWQPIDTAPKDGTDILVYDDSDMAGGHVDIADWRRDRWANCEGFTVLPTHWMPLPAPPSESDAYPLDKPIPRLPDMYLWWPGKEDGKPRPPIMWLDDKPERRDE